MTYSSVLPCSTISDHDGPYACINIRVNRFQPRFKWLRNEKQFDKQAFNEDLRATPSNLVYRVEHPDEKLKIFNSLLRTCIDKRVPLRKTKIIRPPAPWLHKENIRKLQRESDQLRYLAHQTNLACVGDKYRKVRNKIRTETKKVKRSFYKKALSSKKPKELWNTIHRILNPTP